MLHSGNKINKCIRNILIYCIIIVENLPLVLSPFVAIFRDVVLLYYKDNKTEFTVTKYYMYINQQDGQNSCD